MPDFMVEPSERDPERPERRPVRLVSAGLAPTAEPPKAKRGKAEAPSCSAPCAPCGQPVLRGRTTSGTRLAVAPGWRRGQVSDALAALRGDGYD